MDLGINSLSLTVKDIRKAFDFYQKLGFQPLEGLGSLDEKWIILKNGEAKIGLFQEMFPQNIMTFNPTNARVIYKKLKSNGVEVLNESESIKAKSGICHFAIQDPDGNQILFDQHND